MSLRQQLGQRRRWVIKIGSALLTNDGRGLDRTAISAWSAQMAALLQSGHELVLVSSGAVAEGMNRLGWHQRPRSIYKLQAAAAVGQMGLVQAYESCFQEHGRHTAQVLLTHEDLSHRRRYLNARSTLRELIDLGVVPVVNENDTVATEEIQFGDNDTLAALVANLVEADLMIILTDQAGIFEQDPRKTPGTPLIEEARAGDPHLEEISGSGGALGRGGMLTKVRAAARAARSGTHTLIASGRVENVLAKIAAGESVGTLLKPFTEPLLARKQWLAGQMKVKGALTLDAGAVQVLRESGRSLLPVGVTAVQGQFQRGELVSCQAPDGTEVARGLVNYNVDEATRIAGQASIRIEGILGYVDEPELIHRDNLVLV